MGWVETTTHDTTSCSVLWKVTSKETKNIANDLLIWTGQEFVFQNSDNGVLIVGGQTTFNPKETYNLWILLGF